MQKCRSIQQSILVELWINTREDSLGIEIKLDQQDLRVNPSENKDTKKIWTTKYL